MLEKTIGFIGCGNMGSAMIGGITGSGLVPASKVIASAHTSATVEKIKDQFGIRTTLDNQTVAKEADILFLAVKPYLYAEVITEIKDVVSEDAVIVAIAAGQSIGLFRTSGETCALHAKHPCHGLRGNVRTHTE